MKPLEAIAWAYVKEEWDREEIACIVGANQILSRRAKGRIRDGAAWLSSLRPAPDFSVPVLMGEHSAVAVNSPPPPPCGVYFQQIGEEQGKTESKQEERLLLFLLPGWEWELLSCCLSKGENLKEMHGSESIDWPKEARWEAEKGAMLLLYRGVCLSVCFLGNWAACRRVLYSNNQSWFPTSQHAVLTWS